MGIRRVMVFWGKLIAFLCVLAVAVNSVGTVLDGGEDIMKNASSLKRLPRNSVDVLWAGTSHMHHNVIPQLLYDEYGITSAMAAGNSIDLEQTYRLLHEALRRQSPRVVVLDVYAAAAPYCYFYVQNVLAMRNREGMKAGNNPYNTATGLARWLPLGSPDLPFAIAEAARVSGAPADAYFSITRMHERYGSLNRRSFMYARGEDRLSLNFGYLYSRAALAPEDVSGRPYSLEEAMAANERGTFWQFTQEQLDEAALLPQVEKDLLRIIRLARGQGVELVLCAAPYLTNAAEEKLFAQVGELAAREGVPYVGLDASGVGGYEELRDIGHLNDEGARRYTAFWGEYLREHYGMEDRRESADARYAPWRERVGAHDAQDCAMRLLELDVGLTGYLEALCGLNEDDLILFRAIGNVFEGFREDDYWLLVDELGIPEDVLQPWWEAGAGVFTAVVRGKRLLRWDYRPELEETTVDIWHCDGQEVRLESGRWYVNGQSAGKLSEGMNIAVFSIPDHRLMDNRAFDMIEPVFD